VAADALEAPGSVFSIDGIDVRLGQGLMQYAYDAGVDVTSVVSQELARIQRALHAPPTTITIELGGNVVPETGVGGGVDRRDGAVSVTVALKDRAAFRKALLERVPVTMAHELNHAKRMLEAGQCWSAEFSTMSEALICEGLGDSFAREIYPDRPTPHSDALSRDQEARMWTKIEPKLDDRLTPQGFFAWFASRTGAIPRWTGYTIGFHIVRSYLRSHPGRSAVDITLMDADEIVADSGYDGRPVVD
jgi:hypothetical protein